MNAILWDGNKKLYGQLIIGENRIQFNLHDFDATELIFDLAYSAINKIEYYNLYGLESAGIVIKSSLDKESIFLVDDPIHLMNELKECLQSRPKPFQKQ